MNTHFWAFHPLILCTYDFDNEALHLYRSVPILAKTRNLSSHTTCRPTRQ